MKGQWITRAPFSRAPVTSFFRVLDGLLASHFVLDRVVQFGAVFVGLVLKFDQHNGGLISFHLFFRKVGFQVSG
jgi:hypothetical protein